VRAVLQFLRDWDPNRCPLPEDMAPGDLTTFKVEDRLPMDTPAVRAFWARTVGGGGEGGVPGQCLICGAQTHLVERLPVPVKGIPNGQSSGVALVSANANAFESYGRSAALTSPICGECGERFGKAANALLQDDKCRFRVGPAAYLFWTSEGESDFVNFLSDPRPEDVRLLLESARQGRLRTPADDADFYATSVTAAISRAVFRDWLHTTVGAARRNLERWFRLQRSVDREGAEGAPLSIFRLAVSLYREPRDIVARVPDALLHCALHGGPLPEWLLHQAVQRCRAEQDVTYPRAALIKAVLASHETDPRDTKEDTRMERLDRDDTHPAYLCGRLLAELEAIQRVAINPKATLVDRYYGTASSAPASVFGTLLRGAQPHLAVLRKTRPGAYSALQRRLEEISEKLPPSLPGTLDLKDQARFALGYYHQRAEDRRAARDAKERKQRGEDAPIELADDTD
jgi:CRISPR-associated protein Csd1